MIKIGMIITAIVTALVAAFTSVPDVAPEPPEESAFVLGAQSEPGPYGPFSVPVKR